MQFSRKDQEFREEVRDFIANNLPEDTRRRQLAGMDLTKDDFFRWHRALYKKGWIAPSWPKEWGGCEWTAVQKYIFDDEVGLAGAPRLPGQGLNMVGPVLIHFGTKQQKEEHLPKILSGERFWCQGYSEPGSGSDLASLKTRAVRDGDDYVINGQKIWTSRAHYADWIFLLARTSVEKKKQDGISFLIFPMTTPGVEVRPIILLNGLHHTNETFYTDVRVPVSSIVGEEGKGWTIAKYLLGHERMGGGALGVVKTALKRVKEIAAQERDGGGGRLIDQEDFKRRLGDAEMQLMATEQYILQALAAFSADREIGSAANAIKIRRSEIEQLVTELGVVAAGYYANPINVPALRDGWNGEPVGAESFNPLVPNYMFFRAASIYSGTNEIQHNVIAKAQLGL